MDVNIKLNLKEQMNISIDAMCDALYLLDATEDVGAVLTMWQAAIEKAKETRIRIVLAKKSE